MIFFYRPKCSYGFMFFLRVETSAPGLSGYYWYATKMLGVASDKMLWALGMRCFVILRDVLIERSLIFQGMYFQLLPGAHGLPGEMDARGVFLFFSGDAWVGYVLGSCGSI